MKTALSLVFLCLSLSVFAQQDEELLTPLSKAEAAQFHVSNKRSSLQIGKGSRLIRVGSLARLQKNGFLSFKIPDQKTAVTAQVTSVDYRSDRDYEWFGEITSTGQSGHVILLSKDGKVTGHIAVGDDKYNIFHLEKDIYSLVKLEHATGADCMEPHALVSMPQPEPAPEVFAQLACPTATRVLILSTAKARAIDPNIDQTIDLGVAEFNSALTNSKVWNQSAKLELAGHEYFDIGESNYSYDQDIKTLAGNGYVASLRTAYKADIVVLLTNADYMLPFSQGGGFLNGLVHNIGPLKDSAFAIVEVKHAVGSDHTFAHEVGHLFGGRHDSDLNPDTRLAWYAHGYKFTKRVGFLLRNFVDLMAPRYGSPIPRRLLQFSNPNVMYIDTPTGTADFADVARRIRETADTVSAFMPSAQPLAARISGPTYLPLYAMGEWAADQGCGEGPYTYQWETSRDGINYSSAGSGPVMNSPIYQCGQRLIIRLNVSSADGQAAHASATVLTDQCPH